MISLCALWILWCVLHSVFITKTVTASIGGRFPRSTRYHRLCYNGLAIFTLAPLGVFTKNLAGEVVFGWQGSWLILRAVLLVLALLLFWGGAQHYDLGYFLGIRQYQTGQQHVLLADDADFTATGVFAITRHPWYLGTLLFIWSILNQYPMPVFLAATILSGYLVVGSLLEERRIMAVHGVKYGCYRQQVSMLIPWKWLKRLW